MGLFHKDKPDFTPKDSDWRIEAARKMYHSGDKDTAPICANLANLGNVEAEFMLGKVLYFGECCVREDPRRGMTLLQHAAERGYTEAAYWLGRILQEEKPKEAFRWLLKSAEGGWAEGEACTGLAYAQGTGVGKNPAEAFKWYTAAARSGSANGMLALGAAYANGEGTESDIEKALGWLEAGALCGSEGAAEQEKVVRDAGFTETKPDFDGIKAGDQVWFGHYATIGSGGESRPLAWVVLQTDGDSALMIARDPVDTQSFGKKIDCDIEFNVGWEDSEFRKWLNSDYLRGFAGGEEQLILPTEHGNGPETLTDRVFLLEFREISAFPPLPIMPGASQSWTTFARYIRREIYEEEFDKSGEASAARPVIRVRLR